MKTTWNLSAIALATAFALPAASQTVLKFSHTDQQAGARQAAAVVFAKKVEELTAGRYKVQINGAPVLRSGGGHFVLSIKAKP